MLVFVRQLSLGIALTFAVAIGCAGQDSAAPVSETAPETAGAASAGSGGQLSVPPAPSAGSNSSSAGTYGASDTGGQTSIGGAQSVAIEPAPLTVSFQHGLLPTPAYLGASDATLEERNPSKNLGNSPHCDADADDGDGVDKSCVLAWDITSIPQGSKVKGASIVLSVVDGSTQLYDVDLLRTPWNEPEVTWLNATNAAPWIAPGAMASADRGDKVGTIGGTKESTQTLVLGAAGIAAVQAWVDGEVNAGFIIATNSSTDGIDFASSEHGTVSRRPMLTISYVPPPGSSGVAGAAGAAGATSSSGGAGGMEETGGMPGAAGSAGSVDYGGSTEPNLLVAFMGDQGNDGNADGVLQLIKAEKAAAVVHSGDFDYHDDPASWNQRIDSILGPNYPYFSIIGNHDAARWDGADGYGSYVAARRARVPEMQCSGELGIKSICRFRGLYLVESCVGVTEYNASRCAKDSPEQVDFIKAALSADDSIWSMCAWHKNQRDMQIGGKGDEVGWKAYRACMDAGAIIATAHEHSYARTRNLTDIGNAAAAHGLIGEHAALEVANGRSFVFVSGLGGTSIRDYLTSHDTDSWWSSYYAANRWLKNGVLQTGAAAHGAFFIRFHVDGDPKRARAYFKDVNGRIADEFTITTQ